jgi:hypothetical protein
VDGYKKAECYRSDKNGNADTREIHLAVKAQRKYSELGGINTCRLWYKFKVYDGLPISKDNDEIPLLDYGEAGSFDGVIDGEIFYNEKSYTVEIGVTDKMGNTNSVTYFIATANAAFHLAKGGTGASFGGYSKGDGLEVLWKSTFTGAVQGNVFGLGLLPQIRNGSDINQYTTPGVYAVISNASAATMTNLPLLSAGRLIVSSADGRNRTSGMWAYILQEFISYDGHYHYYRMLHTEDTANEWIVNDWRCESSTDWQDLGRSSYVNAPTNTNGRAPYDCAYRVVDENHVYVAFNCGYTFSGSNIIVNKELIPEKYRPKNLIAQLCPTNGRTIARVYVSKAGEVAIEWVQDMTATALTTSFNGTWIDGYIDYWI